jgi:hypothetical protein
MRLKLEKPLTPEEAKLTPEQRARKKAYPSVEEQLDMLWRAMDTGEVQKALEFYNAIKKIKDAVPKK